MLEGSRKAGGNGVTCYALPASDSGGQAREPTPSRVGLVVRAPNRAVVRNRIKRRLRAAFVACDPEAGYDVVVRADERAKDMSFTELTGRLNQALGACGVQTGTGVH